MGGLTNALAALTAGAALAMISGGADAQTLGWSFAATGVGSCNVSGGCTPAQPPVYVTTNYQYGLDMNASSTSTDPTRGFANASANPGSGYLALPELHSDVTGAPSSGGAYSWNYSVVQGAIGYTWTGAPVDLAVSTFVGAVDFTNSQTGVGFASAAFAILDSSVTNPAVGNLWYPADDGYGFAADCSTAGAIAIGETGANFAKGAITTVVSPTCGAPTFHLDTGDSFYFWARLETFEADNGVVDASHTFTVSLNPTLSQTEIDTLTANLEQAPSISVAVPEPGAWALMLLGFGAVGAAARRRRLLRSPAIG